MDLELVVFSLLATFVAAALTVPAGFGLATMITPVVFLWLDPHEAVAVVAIVHGSHNAWKLKVLRRKRRLHCRTSLWLGDGGWCAHRGFTQYGGGIRAVAVDCWRGAVRVTSAFNHRGLDQFPPA